MNKILSLSYTPCGLLHCSNKEYMSNTSIMYILYNITAIFLLKKR